MPDLTLSAQKIKSIIKLHQKKYRDEMGLFIAEGYKALEECLYSNIEIVDIYAQENAQIPKEASNITYINEKTMKKISTTASVCEILTVAKKKNIDPKQFPNFRKIALLENISDPGNLGTIIRSAAAFGIEGIILFSDCTELYSPKVIRSCAGNFFKIPVIAIKNTNDLKMLLPEHTFVATALSRNNNISLYQCSKINKLTIMLGSEAKGLSSELINISDYNIHLDMTNNVESLNVAVCASIIFYELSKHNT